MARCLAILLFLMPSVAFAGKQYSSYIGTQDLCLNIGTTDGSVSNVRCKDLKVSDGFFTDQGSYYLLRAGVSNGGYTSMTTSDVVVSTSYSLVKKKISNLPAYQSGTLADGLKGQILTIQITEVETGGTFTIIPSRKTGFSSIVFDEAGQDVTLLYVDDTTGWIIIDGLDTTSIAWGEITGTLSVQTDLQTALDGKLLDTGDIGVGTYVITGNLGIGSSSPGSTLDIQGITRTTEFQLTTNPSSSYVLTSNTVGVGTWMPLPTGGGTGTVTSVSTSAPLIGGTFTTSGTIGIGTATTSTDGYLTSTDWNTFNSKQAAGAYITAAGVPAAETDAAHDTCAEITGCVENALTAVTADSPLSGSGTSGSHLVLSTAGTWSGNAGTATALAADGANCTAGNYPLGVSASGAVQDCTAIGAGSNYWTLTAASGNVGISTTNTVGIGTTMGSAGLSVMNGNVGIGTWNPIGAFQVVGTGDNFFGSNVGINTTITPQALYVAGTIEGQGFKLNQNAAAGYVLTSTTVGVGTWMPAPVGGSGAPTTVDYLVGTADGTLSAEIVVGTSPGGELGGTWASPTLDDSVTVNGWTLGSASLTAASNLTSNGFVKTSGGVGTLSVDTSTYLTAESDPQVGTLTNTKWCTTDGSAVNCTTDAPAGTGNVSNTGTPADNQVAVWTNSTTIEGSNSFIFNGTNVGIGTLLPLSVLEARGATGLTISGQENLSIGGKCSANITADLGAALDVTGCRYYSFTSNNATSTNRTFCLLAGTEGQVITLFADVASTNEIELGDGAAGACAGATGAATFLAGVWPAATNQNNDSANIIYRTTASGAQANGWYEIGRAAN